MPNYPVLVSTGQHDPPRLSCREARKELIELARHESAAHRLAWRASALAVIDDVTNIFTWHCLYQEDGIEGLASLGYEGSACRLSKEQQDKLKVWATETLPRSTRATGV